MEGGKEVCKSETGVDTDRGVKSFAGVALEGVIPRCVLSPKLDSSPKRLLFPHWVLSPNLVPIV